MSNGRRDMAGAHFPLAWIQACSAVLASLQRTQCHRSGHVLCDDPVRLLVHVSIKLWPGAPSCAERHGVSPPLGSKFLFSQAWFGTIFRETIAGKFGSHSRNPAMRRSMQIAVPHGRCPGKFRPVGKQAQRHARTTASRRDVLSQRYRGRRPRRPLEHVPRP
jgi:hypothetical protein